MKRAKWKIHSLICSEVVAAGHRDAIRAAESCQKWFRMEKPINWAALILSKIQTVYAWMYSALSPSESKGLWKVNRDHLAGRAPGEIVGRERERLRQTALHAEQSKVIQRPQRDGKSVGLRARKIKSLNPNCWNSKANRSSEVSGCSY